IDLGKTRKIAGFRYLARQLGSVGAFAKTEFFVGDSEDEFGEVPVATATFVDVKSPQSANCDAPVSGRYVLVRMVSEIHERPNATAAEIGVIVE
ncbi:MAG: discoidin domain-containing protein, partial [Verrucomicrobiota bacterium]